MKKILFVTTSSLESENYTGDTVRARNIIKHLGKNNKIDIACFNKDKKYKRLTKNGKINSFKENNILLRLFYIAISFFKLEPLQLGYFYSKKIKKFL